MNEVQLFQNEQFGQIRTVDVDGKVYFVAVDVTNILGYKEGRKAVERHCKWGMKRTIPHPQSKSASIEVTVIPESDVYRLIVRSQLESAQEFEKWVFDEVLPSIRKTGMYITTQKAEELMMNPDYMIKVFTELKKEKEARIAAEQQIEQDKPKVALANAITASTNSILVRDLAKIITQNGYEIGEKRLYKMFREMGYLIKKQGLDHNRPTQFSMNKGLFEVKENTVENKDGSILTKFTTLVTGKGQMYFINKFKEWAEFENEDNQG